MLELPLLLGFSATYKGKSRDLGRENTLIGTAWVTSTEHTQRCSKRKEDRYLLFINMALREVETGRNSNTAQRDVGPGIHRNTQKERKTWGTYEHPKVKWDLETHMNTIVKPLRI